MYYRAPSFRPILLGYVRLGLDEKTLDENELDEKSTTLMRRYERELST